MKRALLVPVLLIVTLAFASPAAASAPPPPCVPAASVAIQPTSPPNLPRVCDVTAAVEGQVQQVGVALDASVEATASVTAAVEGQVQQVGVALDASVEATASASVKAMASLFAALEHLLCL